MKPFIENFNDDAIIDYLCKLRARNAKQRNQKHLIHLLSFNPKYNYHQNEDESASEYEKELIVQLNKILPSRRKWKNIGKDSRYKNLNGRRQKITSVEKNVNSLHKTIQFYKNEHPEEPFLLELQLFIEDIRNSIISPEYRISKPIVYPKPKNKVLNSNENICRPITLFTLKDRLILSFTNNYLTKLFDPFFHSSSLAFRSLKVKDGNTELVNHHTAIKEILKFKGDNFKTKTLWVAECDMKKFYDTVNHDIILSCFNSLISKAKNAHHDLDYSIPVRIFHRFLDSYSFNTDVLPLNVTKLNEEYWKHYKIRNGKFGWVEKELNELKFYCGMKYLHVKPNWLQRINTSIKSCFSDSPIIYNSRIGIPQGGALSGLIANMVLDYTDRQVAESGTLYLRFCDDMILMNPDKEKCESKVQIYRDTLKELMLVPHEFCKVSDLTEERKEIQKSSSFPLITTKPFWKEKSKGPYKWDDFENGGFPWIGFVGYEIHHKGYLRVRKSSLIKEKDKQKEVVEKVKKAIKDNLRAEIGTVSKSTILRLIGMSVGRVNLWEYNKVQSEMCWKNGFKELNMNPYSIKQMKYLDRLRNRLHYQLVKDLKKMEDKDKEIIERSNSQIINYNKPFSYYYQILERSEETDN